MAHSLIFITHELRTLFNILIIVLSHCQCDCIFRIIWQIFLGPLTRLSWLHWERNVVFQNLDILLSPDPTENDTQVADGKIFVPLHTAHVWGVWGEIEGSSH